MSQPLIDLLTHLYNVNENRGPFNASYGVECYWLGISLFGC